MGAELVEKASNFQFARAIDTMEEFGWCPKPECGKVAEIRQQKGMGECTWCYFKFCLQCTDTFHPFKRCKLAKVQMNDEIYEQTKSESVRDLIEDKVRATN